MRLKISNYTFNKTAKTVTFTDYTTIRLDGILGITNVTDGIEIFNFMNPVKGGTVLNNVLTLAYDTSAMDNADKLLIYYDDTADEVALASNQALLESLVETLQELVQRLAPLASVIASTGALRTTPVASISTAVTGSVTATGGGYITSTQSIAEKTVGGIMYTTRVAQENLAATLGNINNAIGK